MSSLATKYRFQAQPKLKHLFPFWKEFFIKKNNRRRRRKQKCSTFSSENVLSNV